MIHWATASTDDKIAAIELLSEAGLVFGQIADELGIKQTALHGFTFRNRHRVKRPPAKLTAWHLLRTGEARAARVRELDDAGMSTEDIGAMLGVTPRQIVRMMTKRRDPVINGGPRACLPSTPVEPRFPVHPLPPPETWAPHREPVGLLAAVDDECRWPIEIDGEPQGFCGDHVHAKSFCAKHYAMAYRPAGSVRPAGDMPKEMRARPMASRTAMKLTGAAPRKPEIVD